jgi:TolB protein
MSEQSAEATTKLLFTSSCTGIDWYDASKTYSINLDGSGLRRITNTGGGELENWPQWSPDGRQVVFSSDMHRFYYPDGKRRTQPLLDTDFFDEIYLVDIDDGTPQRLTYDRSGYYFPRWSSIGMLIFSSAWQLYTLNPDSQNTKPTFITKGRDPRWSPDGRKLVFKHDTNLKSDLFVMNENGSGLRNLTKNPSTIVDFDWSPDGKQIVFNSRREEKDEIYAINIDGTHLVQLTSNEFYKTRPVWSPDGSMIAYGTFNTDNSIYIIGTDGSQLAQMKFPQIGAAISWLPDSSGVLFFVKDDPPLDVCQDFDLYSIYRLNTACIQSKTGCAINDAVRIPNSEATEPVPLDISRQKAR